VQLSQDAAPCTFTLSHGSDQVGPAATQVSVHVATLSGCSWTSSSRAPWIEVVAGRTAMESATVTLAISANDGGKRVGAVIVAGQTYTVVQEAANLHAPGALPPAAPPPEVPPPANPPPAPPFVAEAVNFETNVESRSGTCPDVTFAGGGWTVLTSAVTEYRHGSCADLVDVARVHVRGTTRPGGGVDATRVDLR
jgi:hypothetical protein